MFEVLQTIEGTYVQVQTYQTVPIYHGKYYANTKWNPDWAPADRKNYFITRTAVWKTNTKADRADELTKLNEKHERAQANKE